MDKRTHDYMLKTMARNNRGRLDQSDIMLYNMSCRNNKNFIANQSDRLTNVNKTLGRYAYEISQVLSKDRV